MRESFCKYLRWFLPLLFIAYFGSISIFTHVHVEYGTTIVHAHPFKKTIDGNGHHHDSLAEIQLFHQLSSLDAMDGAIHPLELRFFASYLLKLSEELFAPDYQKAFIHACYLRAPPMA